MRYMGINNIEYYIAYKLNDFYKNNEDREIVKILLPRNMWKAVRGDIWLKSS